MNGPNAVALLCINTKRTKRQADENIDTIYPLCFHSFPLILSSAVDSDEVIVIIDRNCVFPLLTAFYNSVRLSWSLVRFVSFRCLIGWSCFIYLFEERWASGMEADRRRKICQREAKISKFKIIDISAKHWFSFQEEYTYYYHHTLLTFFFYFFFYCLFYLLFLVVNQWKSINYYFYVFKITRIFSFFFFF